MTDAFDFRLTSLEQSREHFWKELGALEYRVGNLEMTRISPTYSKTQSPSSMAITSRLNISTGLLKLFVLTCQAAPWVLFILAAAWKWMVPMLRGWAGW